MAEVVVKTRILFFGRLAEQIGREHEVDVPETGCSVAELRRRLAAQGEPFDALAAGKAIAAVDQEIASEETMVVPGQEIAFFSPLSGG
ncbi:MAG: MoaD/ThiS family protein [Sphingomonadales bacterium]